MKRAEVLLPEPLYEQVEGLAKELHLIVPEVLCRAAEQLVCGQGKTQQTPKDNWRFPEGCHLGPFRAAVEDWRLLVKEAAA